MNLEECNAYKQLALKLDREGQETIQKAIRSHLSYMVSKAIVSSQKTSRSLNITKAKNLWDKVHHQFLIELLIYQGWESKKDKYHGKRAKNNRKYRRG